MAITASIALGSSTVNTLQPSAATLTVSNSGGSAVTVTSVQPSVVVHGTTQVPGGVNIGQPNTGPGMNLTVPAGGSLATLGWSVVPMAPNVGVYTSNPFPSSGVGGVAITPLQPESQPAQQLYDVGAIVTTSDGSVVSATVAQLTVNSVRN